MHTKANPNSETVLITHPIFCPPKAIAILANMKRTVLRLKITQVSGELLLALFWILCGIQNCHASSLLLKQDQQFYNDVI